MDIRWLVYLEEMIRQGRSLGSSQDVVTEGEVMQAVSRTPLLSLGFNLIHDISCISRSILDFPFYSLYRKF